MSNWKSEWWVDDDCCVARGSGMLNDYETLAPVVVQNEDGSVDVDTSFEFATLMAAAPWLRRLLVLAESFMAGFEEDDLQDEPIGDLLAEMRDAIAATGGNE